MRVNIGYRRQRGTDICKYDITFEPNPGFYVRYDELVLNDKGLLNTMEFIEAYKNNKDNKPENSFFKIDTHGLILTIDNKPVITISNKSDIDYFLDELYAGLVFNHQMNLSLMPQAN